MIDFQEAYAGQKICCFCCHYVQHYGRKNQRYYPLFCGHCTFPHIKNRTPTQTCGHWTAIKEEPVSPS